VTTELPAIALASFKGVPVIGTMLIVVVPVGRNSELAPGVEPSTAGRAAFSSLAAAT
jgi:hypothetical protein